MTNLLLFIAFRFHCTLFLPPPFSAINIILFISLQKSKGPQKAKAKTLKSAWVRWAMRHHAFSDIPLSDEFINQLSGGIKEMYKLDEDADKDENGKSLLATLKYNFPAEPKKPGDPVIPLNNDQKLLNRVFITEAYKLWKQAKPLLQKEMTEGVQKYPNFRKQKNATSESDAKSTADGGGSGAKGSGGGGVDSKSSSAAAAGNSSGGSAEGGKDVPEDKKRKRVLNYLSMGRFREWIEEDEDEDRAETARRLREQRNEAKNGFDTFLVRQKEKDERKREEARRKAATDRDSKMTQAKASKDANKQAFEDWVIQKEMREQARKCLKLMPQPELDRDEFRYDTDIHARVMEVGQNLKKIDRNLIQEWAKWAEQVIGFNTATIMWDAFAPIDYSTPLTTCPRTGMANAYTISAPTRKMMRSTGLEESKSREEGKDSGGDEAKGGDYDDDDFEDDGGFDANKNRIETIKLDNGETRIKVELEDRKKREALLHKYNFRFGDADEMVRSGKDPSASWGMNQRKAGLKFMIDNTRNERQEETLKKMLSEGSPPMPPSLLLTQCTSTSLTLEWSPAEDGDLVSFFSLERLVGQMKDAKYVEVTKDPPSATDEDFNMNYVVDGLQPGTSYQFRIRGFNGFGSGDYTYRIYTTKTDAPPAPRVIKLASDSVTLRWAFSETFFRRMEELRRLFNSIDLDHSGYVCKEEMATALEAKSGNSSVLRNFLTKKAENIGIDISRGYSGLFDAIESNDDGDLSWPEFEAFFLTAGWADTSKSMQIGASMRSSYGSAGPARGNRSASEVTYVVEQCENDFEGKYKRVMSTQAGHGTISRLEPASSYRFRIYSVNRDGQRGAASDAIIVHTMIETPSAPTPMHIDAKSITLGWKGRQHSTSMRDPSVVNKLLSDWAGTTDYSSGVSIEIAFAKYDTNRSGDIDARELALMLEDLGVEVTEERLAEAFDVLDADGNGFISFEEFADWWRGEEVSYVLKRSEPIISKPVSKALYTSTESLPTMKKLGTITEDKEASGVMAGKEDVAMSVVVDRGRGTRYEVMGLISNRLYHFRLRWSGSKCNSSLSTAAVVMTAPMAPSKPVVLDVGSTSVRLKWFAPQYGAFKYIVQLRDVNKPLMKSAAQDPNPGSKQGWITVFNGQETIWTSTTMIPKTTYEARILGANYQGTTGESSRILTFETLERGTDPKPVQKYSDYRFNIECSGDVCVGDTVLITERLFVKDKNIGMDTSMSGMGSVTKRRGDMIRVDVSQASMASDATGFLPPGAFIGERTIAAHVVKDNYRTSRDTIAEKRLTPKNWKAFGKYRYLWLEVIWQRASNEHCKPYELKKGEVIERLQARLEEYDVLRCEWRSEEERVKFTKEYDSLADSYVVSECNALSL